MIQQDAWVTFALGFGTGAATCFLVLVLLANFYAGKEPTYSIKRIGNILCLEVNGEYISCDWTNADND